MGDRIGRVAGALGGATAYVGEATAYVGEATAYLGEARRGLAGDRELRVLFAVFALQALAGDAYGQALPLLFGALGASAGLLGAGLSLASVVQVVLSPVVGVLADAVDRLALVGVGVGCSAALLGGFLLADSPAVAVALVVLYAVAGQLVDYGATPAVNDALDAGFEGIGWGVRDVGLYLGGAVLSAAGDVRVVFLALVPVQVVLVAGLWRTVERDGDGELSPERVLAALTDVSVLSDLRAVSAPGRLGRLLVAKGLVGLGTGASLFLLPLYGVELGLAPASYLFLYSGSLVLAAPLSLVGGALADHVEPKWLFAGNAAVEAAMLLSFSFADSVALFVVGLGLYVLQTGFEPGVITYVFGVFEDGEAGRVWGLSGAVAKAVGVVAPAIGGLLYDAEPRLAFLVGGGITAVGAVVALTMPRRAKVAPGESARAPDG